MFCKNCGKEAAIGNKFCSNCGQELPVHRVFLLMQWFKNNHRKVSIIIGILFLFILIFAISSFLTKNTPPIEQKLQNNTLTQDDVALFVVNLMCFNAEGTVNNGGSGTMMTNNGYILTNYHVLAETDFCLVTIPDPTTGTPNEIYVASPYIFSISQEYDIAALIIFEAYTDEAGTTYGTYPNTFNSYHNAGCYDYIPKLGEDIEIYGYPVTSGGYNLTITDGVISSFTDEGFILTSAKVDSGNSGGIAVNKNGCFVGIPSAVHSGTYQNLGMIIPTYIVRNFLDKVQAE
ncbi:MAG: trypsin-like peptidase domain-containing protein [Minisyncoccia bacterium]